MIHPDTLVWQWGWRKTPKEELAPGLQALVSEPACTIDGVCSRVSSRLLSRM